MSSTIDQRIVEMSFKGATFAQDIQSAVAALTGLKGSLNNLKGAESSINNLDSASKKFSVGGIGAGIESIGSKFSALGLVGIGVLTNLAGKAVSAGISITKSLTIDPIKAGLDVYETKINAIQTILANTQSEGTKLSDVTSALNTLNTYANKTVYNFGQMAQNIGTFTAAGVNLKTSVSSIQGIANLAALSGSSAEQASTAMYQLSQAIAAGKVGLQDWNSVVNAGLGGKVFQTALENTARATGVNIDAILKKAGSFRNSLQQGWLSTKILTQTLDTFSQHLSLSQLQAMGYTLAQSKAIQQQQKIAEQSATNIRTVTQLMAALKEEVATAWSQVFTALIGNIGDATKTLTSLHNTLENILTNPIKNLAVFLNQWALLGGRDTLIASFVSAFKSLSAIMNVVGSAFKEVFPPITAATLAEMTDSLYLFILGLTPTKKGLADLKTIFVGLFSGIKIVVDIIGGLFTGLSQIGGAAKSSGGGLLDMVAKTLSFVTSLRKAIESGNALTTFFKDLGKILAIPVKAFGAIINAIDGYTTSLAKASGSAAPFLSKIGAEFSKIGDVIVKGIESGNIQNVLNILNQGLFAGILLAVRKFISNIGKGSSAVSSGGGLFSSIKESFEGLTGVLESMQTRIKAGTLETIAIAVALLTASLIALSFLNIKKLTVSLGAITVLFTDMMAALSVVTKVSGTTGIVKMVAIGVALNLLAGAILVLSAAVVILARFSWQDLAKGIASITILLGVLIGSAALMSNNLKGMAATAALMKLMAVAISILAVAVGVLGKQNVSTLAKGIGSIAALIIILTGFAKTAGGKDLISTAASMVVLSYAIKAIGGVIESLGHLSVDQLAKGLGSLALTLGLIEIAMRLMPPGMIGTSLGFVLLTVSLLKLSDSIGKLGAMSWEAVAKSLVTLAGALIIISAAMLVMEGALPGAAAMIVAAGAVAILSVALQGLGSLSWGDIGKALVALAGAFIIIGAAGLILTPLIPVLLGLGAAIALLGVGILAAGAGVALFAVGIVALAAAVAVSGSAILLFVNDILSLIPLTAKKIAQGIISFADVIGTGGPAITKAFVAVLTSIFDAIIKVVPLGTKAFGTILVALLNTINKYAPSIVSTFYNLILTILNNIARYYPKFVSAGLDLIVNLLNGIARQIPRVASAAVNVIIAFINAVSSNEVRLVQAGANAVINLINGIANTIRADSPRLNAAGSNLGSAIVQGMISGMLSGLGGIASAAANLANTAISTALSHLHINSPSKDFIHIGESTGEGMALGIDNNTSLVTDSVTTMGSKAISTMKDAMSGLNDVITNGIDPNPTITPVLDLTQAKKGFDDLTSLSKSQLISASASTSTATSISAGNAAAAASAGLVTNGANLTFNQYNTSPTALSAADIYRQTKNQLSVVKGALK